MGVQIACRTGRVSALAVGGFPPLNAPCRLLLEMSRHVANDPRASPESTDPGVLWSAVGFYASLVTWPDRAAVSGLTMPRLAYMGDQDEGQGCIWPVPLADRLRSTENELRAMGWEISWLTGNDHLSADQPDVALPVVLTFLEKALLSG
jgi:hypothetical protein